jgi:hypothetical protein
MPIAKPSVQKIEYNVIMTHNTILQRFTTLLLKIVIINVPFIKNATGVYISNSFPREPQARIMGRNSASVRQKPCGVVGYRERSVTVDSFERLVIEAIEKGRGQGLNVANNWPMGS